MKKKLAAIPVAGLIFAGGFFAHQPATIHDTQVKTKTVTKTVTVQKPQPVYHVGDTQDGVTLVKTYQATYKNPMANGVEEVTYFVVSGVSDQDLYAYSTILTDKGFTGLAAIPKTPQCSNYACGAIMSTSANIYYYKDLAWQL